MYSTAIICVFFISANSICLHCTTKINKLLHKLSRMICFITKSSGQLNPPLFSIYFSPPTCWCCHRFCVISFFLVAPSIYRYCGSRIRFRSSFAYCRHCILSALSNCEVLWSFCYCSFVPVIQSFFVAAFWGSAIHFLLLWQWISLWVVLYFTES